MTGEMHGFGLAEFLAIEDRPPIRHEYVRGQMVAMTGGTARHSEVAARIIPQLSTSACGVCDEPEVLDERLLLNPTVIFEVLSPSTEQVDRFEQLPEYKTIPSGA